MKGVAKKQKKPVGFDDLNEKLDRVIAAMATKEDIENIREDIENIRNDMDSTHTEMAVMRIEMATKQDLQALDEKFTKKFHEVLVIVEGLMKPISELKMEYAGMSHQLSRHEQWHKLIAEKNGIKLPM